MKCYLYGAKKHNPYQNLAIEEFFTNYVTNHTEEPCAIVYFWRNEDSVVFGRNQNIAAECRMEVMHQMKIHPVRRKTGGGAVFHDLENLNFSFIVSKSVYDKEKSMNILQNALISLGIPAEINGRNDILLNGYKISGSAYSSNQQMCLHHGTLLLAANVDMMERLLTVDEKKLASKGVRSVRSRVRNLIEYRPEISMREYEHAIVSSFVQAYQQEHIYPFVMSQQNQNEIENLMKKYASKEWIFGYQLKQIGEVKDRFDWGSCTIQFIDTGETGKYYQIFSDTLFAEEILAIQALLNQEKGKTSMLSIEQAGFDEQTKKMAIDILQLIHTAKERDRT